MSRIVCAFSTGAKCGLETPPSSPNYGLGIFRHFPSEMRWRAAAIKLNWPSIKTPKSASVASPEITALPEKSASLRPNRSASAISLAKIATSSSNSSSDMPRPAASSVPPILHHSLQKHIMPSARLIAWPGPMARERKSKTSGDPGLNVVAPERGFRSKFSMHSLEAR